MTHGHTVGLLWTRDQPVAETCTSQQHKINKRQIFILPVRFEPAIPANEWPQTYVLDCAATRIGCCKADG